MFLMDQKVEALIWGALGSPWESYTKVIKKKKRNFGQKFVDNANVKKHVFNNVLECLIALG